MSATPSSSPSGPSRAIRARTTSRTRSARSSRNGLRVDRHADARARAGRRRRSPSGPAPRTSRRAQAGATVLAARGLTEGTELRDAIALTEAAERLGASLHAESGLGRDVRGRGRPGRRGSAPRWSCWPRSSAGPAFPESEVDRLRDERLTDISRPRRTPAAAPTRRTSRRSTRPRARTTGPSGGTSDTVAGLTADGAARDPRAGRGPGPRGPRGRRRRRRGRGRRGSPSGCSATGAGDASARRRVGRRHAARDERVVRVVHRPGAVQTEIRIGHPGAAAPAPRLPRGLGHGRDPRRAVQLAAQHEPARGEGLHVRRERRASTSAARGARSPPAPRSTPRSPSRPSTSSSTSWTGSARRR